MWFHTSMPSIKNTTKISVRLSAYVRNKKMMDTINHHCWGSISCARWSVNFFFTEDFLFRASSCIFTDIASIKTRQTNRFIVSKDFVEVVRLWAYPKTYLRMVFLSDLSSEAMDALEIAIRFLLHVLWRNRRIGRKWRREKTFATDL